MFDVRISKLFLGQRKCDETHMDDHWRKGRPG